MSEHPLQLRAAYGVCRHIARSAAKNFYYGFLILPAPKRNAISAVYAFMRAGDASQARPVVLREVMGTPTTRVTDLGGSTIGHEPSADGLVVHPTRPAPPEDPLVLVLRDVDAAPT